MMRAAGFGARLVPADDRRHRRAAFRLAVVISTFSHLARLARAGFVFAREGVFAMVDPKLLPLPARMALRIARLIERPTVAGTRARLAAALTRLGPTYVKLGQFMATRPDVVGVALARDLEIAAGQDAAVPAGRGRTHRSRTPSASRSPMSIVSFGPPVAAASIAQVHRAEVATPDGPQRGGGEGDCGRASSGASRPISTPSPSSARKAESWSAEARPAAAGRGRRHACGARSPSRWTCGWRPPRFRRWRRTPRTIPDFRVPTVDWDRTARDVLTLEWIDGTPLYDRARLEAKGFDLKALGARGDPDLPAPCLARRLLPRRHASGQSVRRRRRQARRGRFRHHGPARRRRNGASSPRSSTASSRAIITAPPRCISRPAMCRATIRSRVSRRRSAPSASRSTTAPPKTFRWRSC